MSSLKEVYLNFYPKLIRVLPMSDAIFIARLYSSQFLPGDAKDLVASRPTRADKATYFLDNYIANAFDDDDGSNPLFTELLNLMEKSDDMVLNRVASDINNKLKK